jgi:hypothetical protein
MTITCDRKKTEARLLALEHYLTTNVLGSDFICQDEKQCRDSHAQTFYEGQLHHLGKYYDLLFDDVPLRVVVVGQEYGEKPSHVSCQDRYNKIMESAREYRFKAEHGYNARNPHMRGTTSALRLLFGGSLGTDHNSEFIEIEGERVHIFDMFALVNYLLCSAVSSEGTKRGKATPTMKENCKGHFREVLCILEPTVVIVQGKTFWKWVRAVFDSVEQENDLLYRARIGATETFVVSFAHPSARHPNNWGTNYHTKYLLGAVAPTIASLRSRMQLTL